VLALFCRSSGFAATASGLASTAAGKALLRIDAPLARQSLEMKHGRPQASSWPPHSRQPDSDETFVACIAVLMVMTAMMLGN
jgi:hypothetical protein